MAGGSLQRLAERLAMGCGFFPIGLAWRDVAGDCHEVTGDELHSAVRRWFSWRDLLCRAAGALASFGFSYAATAEAQRQLLIGALVDSWPVQIEQAPALVAAARRAAAPVPCATEQGLLWLISDALAEPWDQAEEPLSNEQTARSRFARLSLLASNLERKSPASSGSARLPTTMVLLAQGRLAERDSAIRWLVRLTEIYDELLAPSAEIRDRFKQRQGVELRTWIVKVCSLASHIEQEVGPGRVRTPLLPLAGAPDTAPARDLVAIVGRLARSGRDQQAAIQRSRSQAPDERLAFQALREAPILDLGNEEFLVLHKDFLLAAADDGVWYALASLVGRDFGSYFGAAFETYVERVLGRIAEAAGARVARVPRRDDVPRCDFACRVGDDLLLVDAKRTGLSALHLMGAADAEDRLIDELGHGCAQLLATARDFSSGNIPELNAALDVPIGWKPRRVLPLLVTHRPVFILFSSAEHLIRAAGLEDEWGTVFRSLPHVWSIADLELLEAAAPTVDLAALFQAADERLAELSAGLPSYLSSVNYVGMIASAYFDNRRHEILAAYQGS